MIGNIFKANANKINFAVISKNFHLEIHFFLPSTPSTMACEVSSFNAATTFDA